MDVYDYTRPASVCHVRGYHRHVTFNLELQRSYSDSRIEDVRFSFSKFDINAAEKIDILSQHETMPITRTDAWHLCRYARRSRDGRREI